MLCILKKSQDHPKVSLLLAISLVIAFYCFYPMFLLLPTFFFAFLSSFLLTSWRLEKTDDSNDITNISWSEINKDSLDKQFLFWFLIITPVLFFIYLEHLVVMKIRFEFDIFSFNYIFKNSSFPISILALSPIFGVFITYIHRSIQTEEQIKKTEKQIDLTKNKNRSDLYYSHLKFVTDEFKRIDSKKEINYGNNESPFTLRISRPIMLYKSIFNKSSPNTGVDYETGDNFNKRLLDILIFLNETVSIINEKFTSEKIINGDSDRFEFCSIEINEMHLYLCTLRDILLADISKLPKFDKNVFNENACYVKNNFDEVMGLKKNKIKEGGYTYKNTLSISGIKARLENPQKKKAIYIIYCFYELTNLISIHVDLLTSIVDTISPDTSMEIKFINKDHFKKIELIQKITLENEKLNNELKKIKEKYEL